VLRAVLACSTVLLAPTRAAAQSARRAPESSDDATQQFRDGVRALQDNRFADAARIFESLRRAQSSAATLFNLATAYRGLGRVRDALECLDHYLELPVETGALPADAVRQEIARLRASLIVLNLAVERPTAGVSVSIDGRAQIDGQRAFELDPVAHIIEVASTGYGSARIEVDGTPGQRISRTISLVPIGPRLVVEADAPGSRVRVDGADRGRSPLELELAPGSHSIVVDAAGYERTSREVVLGPSGVVRLSLSLSRSRSLSRGAQPSSRPWLVPVIAGTASALVVAAVVTGVILAVNAEPPVDGAYSLGVLREPTR